ncbi:MAG: archaellin/type IV pilin N-terminal domain-containing protein [Thermoplasmata archaeon]
MKLWGKMERSWRRKNGRGVSPIIATILLVAITVVLAAVLYILIQQYTKGSNSVTLGSALAIGGSTDGSNAAGTTNYYNMTVETAGNTLQLGSFTFELKSPTGATLVVGSSIGGVAITVLKEVIVNPINTVVATFTPGAATTYGSGCGAPAYTTACTSTSAMTTQYTISVQATGATAPSLSGCTLLALGQGSFSGTTPGTIT